MTRSKIEDLENRLFDKITELNNVLYCSTTVPKLSEDVKLLIEAIKVIKIPISNPVIKKIK